MYSSPYYTLPITIRLEGMRTFSEILKYPLFKKVLSQDVPILFQISSFFQNSYQKDFFMSLNPHKKD